MRPPVCELCGKDFRSRWLNLEQGGELVKFTDYTPDPENYAGHPQGVIWFCDDHKKDANERKSLTSANALVDLREKYSIALSPHPSEYGPIPDPQLWIINTGPNIAKVVAIVKEATGLSSQESLDVIKKRQSPTIERPLSELETYKARLNEIGAEAGIFFNDQGIPDLASPVTFNSVGVREKERKNPALEGGNSLPLTWFLVILSLTIMVGYFFGAWWILILFSLYLFVGIVSVAIHWKLENPRKHI